MTAFPRSVVEAEAYKLAAEKLAHSFTSLAVLSAAFIDQADQRGQGEGDLDAYHSARHDLVMALEEGAASARAPMADNEELVLAGARALLDTPEPDWSNVSDDDVRGEVIKSIARIVLRGVDSHRAVTRDLALDIPRPLRPAETTDDHQQGTNQ